MIDIQINLSLTFHCCYERIDKNCTFYRKKEKKPTVDPAQLIEISGW
jgi:hypothetical protein